MEESFKGCIQDFYLNGKPVDVINSLQIMGVRQCFSTTERGVHFDSFGFAIYGLYAFSYVYVIYLFIICSQVIRISTFHVYMKR